jgi:hypothetical protein
MPKHIGRGDTPTATDTITLDVLRDGEPAELDFQVRPYVSFGSLAVAAEGMGTDDPQKQTAALVAMVRILRMSMVDTDGTPAKWHPTITDGHFTAPNGDHTPTDDLPKWTGYEAGSSRRRFNTVIDSDTVEITQAQIVEAFQFVVALAGSEGGTDRPTKR